MDTQKLASEYRDVAGKGAARKLRATGRIPAVLYGHKEEPASISISEQDFRKILATNWETAIVDLDIKGNDREECNAIIKDIQAHPATGQVLHVDFQHIRRGEKIRLTVPVSLVGDPRGVKEMGGILEHGSRELAIRCMPRHIPDNIQIDVHELGIHDAIHVKDIISNYPDLEFLDDGDSTLAIVVPPKVEVEPTVAEEEEVEGAEEPEVIAKGKEEKGEESADKGAAEGA
jgi:large subunit ribosomal protein L25